MSQRESEMMRDHIFALEFSSGKVSCLDDVHAIPVAREPSPRVARLRAQPSSRTVCVVGLVLPLCMFLFI